MSMSILLTDVPVLVPQLLAISAVHQMGTLDDVSWCWIHWIQGCEGKPPVSRVILKLCGNTYRMRFPRFPTGHM